MRVIDSYNGCGFYAVGADSAKSAASAASAAKYIDGADLASKDYVAYNYVKLSAYNSDMATSNMSSKVETCMQYSTWLPATYYRKTDTSSKDELSAAFANVTGGGGGTGDMLVSKLEFNASDEITGYDGSAFAQGGGGGSKVDSTARLCIIGNNNTASLSSVSSDATFVQGVENSAYVFSFAQGYTNTAYNCGMAQGKSNLAYIGFAQGTSNTASRYSISIGNLNKAINDSISIGIRNTACYNSLAIGSNNTANSGTWTGPGNTGTLTGGGFSLGYSNNTEAFSFGLGQSNYASGFSISLGYNCTAKDYSQSFGLYNVITDYGMVIGKYNKTSANAAFVIGNGDSIENRSDLFVIDKTGIASGKDFYSENGAKLDLLYKLCSAISSHSTGKFNLILNNGDIEVEEIS